MMSIVRLLGIEDSKRLVKYAKLSNDEFGELLGLLISLCDYDSYISEDFADSLEKEIKSQLLWFDLNTTIVKKTKTMTDSWEELEMNFQ